MILRLVLLFTLLSCILPAQNETTKWYFGQNAALDFMSSPPALIAGSAMNAGEGSASMADAAGNLLFYTCFDIIYNSQNVPMANGTGMINSISSTQSALIVKRPGSSSQYYVFQQSGVGMGANTGFRYSVVDMSLAAGMGSVTTKNVLLYQNPIWQIGEKVTGARHCNGVDVWIIIHEMGSNNFRSYLLTAAGVNPVAVISSVGAGPGTAMCNNCWAGDMKVSPNGRKVAVSHVNLAEELLDFDPATGLLSNPLLLTPNGGYSCEFSPDGSKLYYSYGYSIVQWDLCAGSNAAILASQTTIINSPPNDVGILQMAPDGKIYVAISIGFQALSIGVINNPNLSGVACNYVYPAISIAPALCNWGLPNFMSDFFLPKPAPFTYVLNTAISCQTATFTAPPNITVGGGGCTSSSLLYSGMNWDFGDPASGAANSSALSNPTHDFSAAGTYTVTLALQRNCGADTLRKTITIAPTVSLSVNGTPATCFAGGSATVSASGSSGPYNFLWLPSGITTPVAGGLSPGIYSVTVNDPGLCATTATVLIGLQNSLSGTVTPSQVACLNGGSTGAAAISLSGSAGPFTYTWSGNSQTGPVVTGLAPGLHSLSVNGPLSGCAITLTFQVASPSSGSVLALPSLSVCEKSSVSLSTSFNGSSFQWTGPGSFFSSQQNPVLQNVPATASGIYAVTATDAGYCSITATLALTVYPAPTAALRASKNNLCAPYCTQLKAETTTQGAPITKTTFMVDGRSLSTPTANYCFTKAGAQLVTLSCEDANACKSSAQLGLQAYPTPVADFEFYPTVPVAGLDEVLFTNTSSGDQQTAWYWYLAGNPHPASITKNASWLFETTGTQVMAMVVMNAWGCADTVVKHLQVAEEFCFYIPDTFTPNGDDKNDLFQVKGIGITALELQVFDRWGELLFHANDPKACWDGTYKGVDCKTDIYAWKLKVKGINSVSKDLQGHVTLLR